MTDRNTKVLIIDDESDVCEVLSYILTQAGYTTCIAHDGITGIDIFNGESPDIVILDLCMPGNNGINVLKQIKDAGRETPVIIITAYGEIRTAVEAIKLGACNYFTKPFNNEEILLSIKRAIDERMMRQEIHILRTQLSLAMPLFDQMGSGAEIVKLNELIKRVAPTNFTVVIYGETGTGKEVVARNIHDLSHRKDRPFVVVDCGSIPETLIESELFGFEKGAFTGAVQKKAGYFEAASGGTIFFDEIGNLPMSMQCKMLRVLQERKISHLGSHKEVEIDARVIVAGNERLESLVESGRFRMDLYQRLNEFCIEVPALRKRKDDIIFLCKRFLDITNKELGKQVHGFTKEALETLLTYDWPGNVRELKNVVRRAVLLASEIIDHGHLSLNTLNTEQGLSQVAEQTASTAYRKDGQAVCLDLDINNGKDISLRDMVSKCVESTEKIMITEVLKQTNGNKSRAARILKIDYKTMHYKIKKYGIALQDKDEITYRTPTMIYQNISLSQ